MLGIRPADGLAHRYYEVGLEHLTFEVDRRDEVDEAHARCLSSGARIHFPPEEDRDVGDYYAFSPSTRRYPRGSVLLAASRDKAVGNRARCSRSATARDFGVPLSPPGKQIRSKRGHTPG